MKRTFANQGKSLLALFVLLAGMFLAVNRAEAQTIQPVGVSNSIVWKANTTVLDIAQQQVEFWHQQPVAAPGTSQYNNTTRHAAFYKAIYKAVEAGANVGTAIDQSIGAAASLGGEQEAAFTSRTVLQSLKEEAIDLFRQ